MFYIRKDEKSNFNFKNDVIWKTNEKKNLCKGKCTPYSTTYDDLRIYISNCTMSGKKEENLK